MKQIIDNLNLIKIKYFCTAKDNGKRIKKTNYTLRMNICKGHSDNELLFKIHKELLKLNNKKMNNVITKWAKTIHR
jgi:hypothetical protein